jgi:hypothetical protein
MKDIKSLFGTLLFLLALNSSQFAYNCSQTVSGDPGLTLSGDDKNANLKDECNCGCESCKGCRNKQHEQEWGNTEYGFRNMSDRDFSEFTKLISDRTFESTKLNMSKNVIDINYFSTEQVRELLGVFTFESSKLEIAKYVYKNTTDKKNYFRLYDIFTFESNVNDLDDFIRGNKQGN